jgi:hypothetical protein
LWKRNKESKKERKTKRKNEERKKEERKKDFLIEYRKSCFESKEITG